MTLTHISLVTSHISHIIIDDVCVGDDRDVCECEMTGVCESVRDDTHTQHTCEMTLHLCHLTCVISHTDAHISVITHTHTCEIATPLKTSSLQNLWFYSFSSTRANSKPILGGV